METKEIAKLSKLAKLANIAIEGLKQHNYTIRCRTIDRYGQGTYTIDYIRGLDECRFERCLIKNVINNTKGTSPAGSLVSEDDYLAKGGIREEWDEYASLDALIFLNQKNKPLKKLLKESAEDYIDCDRYPLAAHVADSLGDNYDADEYIDKLKILKDDCYRRKNEFLKNYLPKEIHLINDRCYSYYEVDGYRFHSPIPSEEVPEDVSPIVITDMIPDNWDSIHEFIQEIESKIRALLPDFLSLTEVKKLKKEREEYFAHKMQNSNEYDDEEYDDEEY